MITKNSLLTKDIEKVDVTKEMKEKCFSKSKHYEESIKKVTKEGNIYIIEFAEGYSAFTKKTRKARRIGELQWYSKIATEEKNNGYDLNHYIKEFKQNNIIFNGTDIPEFIDTEKKIKTQENKIKNKAKQEVK
ncbi:MAG: hypothetical protein ILA02_03485 [Clostridia bacterium]|nr:hypothetical protein [Clostridia bacterium]